MIFIFFSSFPTLSLIFKRDQGFLTNFNTDIFWCDRFPKVPLISIFHPYSERNKNHFSFNYSLVFFYIYTLTTSFLFFLLYTKHNILYNKTNPKRKEEKTKKQKSKTYSIFFLLFCFKTKNSVSLISPVNIKRKKGFFFALDRSFFWINKRKTAH